MYPIFRPDGVLARHNCNAREILLLKDVSDRVPDLADEQQTIVAELAKMDRLTAVATFGSMLASPSLHSAALSRHRCCPGGLPAGCPTNQ